MIVSLLILIVLIMLLGADNIVLGVIGIIKWGFILLALLFFSLLIVL